MKRATNFVLQLFPVLLSGGFGHLATAQDGAFSLGAFDVSPRLELGVVNDDNVFQQENNQQSDTIVNLNPSIRGVFDNGVSGITIGYFADVADYQSDSQQDSISQGGDVFLGWSPFDDHRVSVSSSLAHRASSRSPDAASGINSRSVDRFRESGFQLEYNYGADSAPFGVSVLMARDEVSAITNRSENARNNRQTSLLQLGLLRQIGFSIGVSANLGRSDVDFTDDSSRNSNSRFYNLGFSWNPSENYDMSLSLGQIRRALDDGDQDPFLSESIDLGINWSPISYSSFNLGVNQSLIEDDSAAAANFIEFRSVSLGWNHNWSNTISTSLSYSVNDSDFRGTDRMDSENTVAAAAGYQFRRWLNFGVSFSRDERTGVGSNTAATPEFRRNTIGLNLSATL